MTDQLSFIPSERIEQANLVIRGHKVMIDNDLAELYGVTTRTLIRAVKRHPKRFPPGFAFQLSADEMAACGMTGRRRPYAFTELGCVMASSVLKSKAAIQASIWIIRTYISQKKALVPAWG